MAADVPTTWIHFGPDPAYTSLPGDMQACIASPSAACDTTMGSAQTGGGYCASPEYAQTTYCSCVNSAISCPQVTMAACADTEHAYQPAFWVQSIEGRPSQDSVCKAANLCVNLIDVEGDQNVLSGTTQQCGTVSNVFQSLKPGEVAAIALIVAIILAIALGGRSNAGSRSAGAVMPDSRAGATRSTPKQSDRSQIDRRPIADHNGHTMTANSGRTQ